MIEKFSWILPRYYKKKIAYNFDTSQLNYQYSSNLSFYIFILSWKSRLANTKRNKSYNNFRNFMSHRKNEQFVGVQAQFADALTHYHAAIELDPTNYQTLYRRATVYLAMGKSKNAIPDLDKVLQLKSDFTAVRFLLFSTFLLNFLWCEWFYSENFQDKQFYKFKNVEIGSEEVSNCSKWVTSGSFSVSTFFILTRYYIPCSIKSMNKWIVRIFIWSFLNAL